MCIMCSILFDLQQKFGSGFAQHHIVKLSKLLSALSLYSFISFIHLFQTTEVHRYT